MNLKMRLSVVLLIVCALALEIYAGAIDTEERERGDDVEYVAKDTITLWYTDEALTDYLSSVALTYYESTDIHVELKLVSGVEYLETINYNSIYNDEYPDMFIVGNDSLGKAYLSGLASEIKDTEHVLTDSYYCETALNAVTYNGRYVAFPMYYETSYLLYNRTYLEQIARTEVLAEWYEAKEDAESAGDDAADAGDADGAENADGAETGTDADGAENDADAGDDTDAESWAESLLLTEEEFLASPEFAQRVEARILKLVPESIEEILNFADEYDAPENVDSIFKWDVSDIFYNYFFAGDSIQIGGPAGDDPNVIDIYNENTIRCLNIYQDLNQFFSIEADATTYASVMQEFIDGKIIFTLATTDAVAMLENAKEEERFAYEYGVGLIPDLTDELAAKEVSVTNCVAINGYSDKKEAACVFARYICATYSDSLYARTGKASACSYTPHDEDPVFYTIDQAYALSVPMPKVVESSNFWVELEMCFTNIWLGDDANLTLKKLSEQIKKQVTGEDFAEEYIEIVEEEEEEEETYEDEGMDAGTESE
ncbi:MAG: extracellular solute-binding protein [Lachnospiraceae bacterium]|nr:extracellular solute-binding protein [Lachnospiraceae bacterium]